MTEIEERRREELGTKNTRGDMQRRSHEAALSSETNYFGAPEISYATTDVAFKAFCTVCVAVIAT